MQKPNRKETRQGRYQEKQLKAKRFPVSVAITNFSYDGNVAYVMRALACFGGRTIHIIGKVPAENELKRLSGGQSSLVDITKYRNPQEFVDWTRANDWHIVAAELNEEAINFNRIIFNKSFKYIFAIGNEMSGLPIELIKAASILTYIPMPGQGFCLNASQTANIMLYEYAKQYDIL